MNPELTVTARGSSASLLHLLRQWGYKNAQETLAYLKQENEQAKVLLAELGLAAR